MASKKARKPKRGYVSGPIGDWKTDAEVIAILNECREAVLEGLKDPDYPTNPKKAKVLSLESENGLNELFGPKIFARLHLTGRPSWQDEKGQPRKDGRGPLGAAFRLGQIAFLLSVTRIVRAGVANVAAQAILKDEHCQGSGGAGDWCGG